MIERFVVIDIETTGNSVRNGDRMIQIGAVVVQDGDIVERFSQFIDPEVAVPSFIQKLTGINEEMLIGAPTFMEVAPKLLELLNGAYFVAHNVPFDLSFLQNQLSLCGYPQLNISTVDTVELSRLLMPTEDGYKLNELATRLSLSHVRPHQADSDAEVTAELLLYLLNKLECLPLVTLKRLQPLVKKLNSDIDLILGNAVRQKGEQVDIDTDAYDFYRQFALRKRPLLEKDSEVPKGIELFSYQMIMDERTGKLSQVMDNYQARPGQLEMVEYVDHALSHSEHLLIEAGTGTGKSLAYLLPALLYAKRSQQCVIISTHTIPLQTQLIERDIPLLNDVMPFPFKVALLKGRSHYLCLQKFEQQLNETAEDNYDTVLAKGQMLVWLTETEHGDIDELNLPSGARALWNEVQSDASASVEPQKNPWFSRCYYQRARRNAYAADLVITNHALLFTDLVKEQQLLPSYTHAVVDEAHHLEEVASDHFGLHSDYFTFHHLLNRLGSLDKNDFLYKVKEISLNRLGPDRLTSEFTLIDKKKTELKNEIDDLFRMLHGFVVSKQKATATEVGRMSYRYQAHREQEPLWQAILEAAMRTCAIVTDLFKPMQAVVDVLQQIKQEQTFVEHRIMSDFKGFITQLEQERSIIEQLLLEHDPDYVYWIEIEAKGAKNATFIYSKPIAVADQLADEFFAKKKSVVMTSATLAVHESFDYAIDTLGLADFGPVTAVIPSPFQYEKQAKLLIPTDIPTITSVSEQEYIEHICTHIASVSNVMKGKMLVLFTSYDMLRKAYHLLKQDIGADVGLIGQGIQSGSRAKLMKTFKQHSHAILLGTSSFWEGVDFPGDDLNCLIIVRLPFSPPGQPVLLAKSEKLREAGENPFINLALPQAVIRFKQGFGRLIRTEKDQGVVIVFDRRITTASYGHYFLLSLPPVPVIEKTMQDLFVDLETWFDER